MTDKPQLAIARTEMELGDEELRAVKHVDQLVSTGLAELGAAYLEYEESRARYDRAKAELSRAGRVARLAEGERAVIMRALSDALNLPPGEWIFDAEKGALVKKEDQDG